MKTIIPILTLVLCFTGAIHADYTFVDDAPDGFIHTRKPGSGTSVTECFIRANMVVAVELFEQEIRGKSVPSVEIITLGKSATGRSISYFLNFKDKAEAKRVAQRIMQLVHRAE